MTGSTSWLHRAARSATATALILVTVHALTAGPAAHAGVQPPAQTPLTEVLTTAGIDQNVVAHYVLLVDTSGSMATSGAYEQVVVAVNSLVAALPPTDLVSIIAFDVAPRQCGAGVIPAADVAALAACLPATPTGDYTDFGRAIDAGLSALSATDAAVKSVVLMSDGEQDPAPGSPYPREGVVDNPAWRDLAARAATVPSVEAFALPLLGSTASAEILGYAFASPDILQVAAPAEISGVLARTIDAVRTQRAATALTADLDRTITIDTQRAPWQITLTSTAQFVPYVLTDLRLDTPDADIDVRGLPSSVTLDPGGSIVLRPRATWATPPESTATSGAGTARPATTVVRLAATVSSPWDSAVTQLGLSVVPTIEVDAGRLAADDVDQPATASTASAAASEPASGGDPDQSLPGGGVPDGEPMSATAPTADAVTGPLRWGLLAVAALFVVAGAIAAIAVSRTRPTRRKDTPQDTWQ